MDLNKETIGQAILDHKIEFAVQPILDARNREMVGAEALFRWNDLGPSCVSSDPSYLHQLCRLECQEPYREILLGQKMAISDRLREHRLALYINFAVEMLADDQYWAFAQSCIGSDPARMSSIVVELSELNLFEVDSHGRAKCWDRLTQIQSLAPDLQFALDDFGTGFNNFDRLRAFRINTIKLDKTLIKDLDQDTRAQTMLYHLHNMANEMGVSLVAEGVETLKEEAALLDLGINLQQGFFRGPPMTMDALESSDLLK